MPQDAPTKAPTEAGQADRVAFEKALSKAATCIESKDFKKFDAAIAEAEAIIPSHPELNHFKGLSLFEQKDAKNAFALILTSARAQPKNPSVKHNLAAVQISLGHFEDAEQNLLRAITLKKDYAEAYHTLAGIHKFTSGDKIIANMEQLAVSGKFTPKDASFLCFALAKAYDDVNLPDKAWPVLKQANAQMDLGFDPERETRNVRDTLTACSPDFLTDKARYGHPSRAPIFIVGMPRSGTTLLESVLDAHPQVHAAGELSLIPAVGRTLATRHNLDPMRHGHGNVLRAMTPSDFYGGGQGYLNAVLEQRSKWFDYFVDKLPDNSFNLGLIHTMLPKARILHIMRHPLDMMFSIYLQRFTAVPYSFKPEDIVHHWKSYDRMMTHWRASLPKGVLLELRYENLVQDKDFAQGFLWNHLGLTPDVEHVNIGGSSGEQRTASRWQVKQPVYTTSREKFRKYEKHMAPFIEEMGGMDAIEAEVAAQESRCALKAAVA